MKFLRTLLRLFGREDESRPPAERSRESVANFSEPADGLRSPTVSPATVPQREMFIDLPGTRRGYYFEIVGEASYQRALRKIRRETRDEEHEFTVELVAEPENPVDGNAVAVIYEDGLQRETIGYLRREHAARYQQLISQISARGQRALCNAKLFGGTREKRHIGVWLDLEAPTIIASKLSLQYTRVKKPVVSQFD